MSSSSSNPPAHPPRFFERVDESDDSLFYAVPRLVVHIDAPAIAAIRGYLDETLPESGAVLDLMSSWRSHLPSRVSPERVVGLGMNGAEMRENPQLERHVVHDLNADPRLPLEDGEFSAAVVTVSVQYMTAPAAVFSEVRRVLAPGSRFHVIYSNRMFPTKAVAVWRAMDDRMRARLIASYFDAAGGWEDVSARDLSPAPGRSDPVYAVSARASLAHVSALPTKRV